MTEPTYIAEPTVPQKYIQKNQNTCSGSRRLFAGLIDVSIVSFMTSLIVFFFYRVIRNRAETAINDTSLIEFVLTLCIYYLLFFLNYFLYQCATFILFRSTLGLKMFGIRIVRDGEEPKFGEFVFRLILIILFFSSTSVVGFFFLPLIYYYLKIDDPYSGPFWDFELRPSDKEHEEPILKMKYVIALCTNVLAAYFVGYNLAILIYNAWDPLIEVSANIISAFDISYGATNSDLLSQYYRDGEYDTIIENIEAQENIYGLKPDVLNIYGLALVETGQPEKAAEIYEYLNRKRMVGLSGVEDYIIYNLGICYYDMYKYTEAEVSFREYLELEPEDVETLVHLAWCIVLETEDSDNDNEGATEMGNDKDNEVATEVGNDNVDVLNQKELKFKEGLKYIEQALKISEESSYTIYNYLDFLSYCGHSTEAKDWIERQDYPNDYESQMALADLYTYAYYYLEAAEIYEKIVYNGLSEQLTHEQWEDALNFLMSSYYDSDYFDEVITLCQEFESEVTDFNLYRWWGNSLFEIGETNSAKEKLNQAVAFDNSVVTYEDRIMVEEYQGDLDAALRDVEKAREIGMSEEDYAYHHTFIRNQLDLTPGEQIFKFVHENYMYRDLLTNPDYMALENELSKKVALERTDYERVNELFGQEDMFSFILYDEWYNDDDSSEAMGSVTVNKDKNTILYMKIDFFSMLTDVEVLRALKSVESTTDKTLVIDLRGNYGGDTNSAYNILDYLTGVTYLGSWEAYNEEDYSYYSEGNVFEFKKIFVLVDDESASSAEIVTLGLKEYVDNTTIIGETTFGKGVGQNVFVNLKERFALYVVNAYWTIGTKNIHGVGIEPDIVLEDATLQEYMAIVRKAADQ